MLLCVDFFQFCIYVHWHLCIPNVSNLNAKYPSQSDTNSSEWIIIFNCWRFCETTVVFIFIVCMPIQCICTSAHTLTHTLWSYAGIKNIIIYYMLVHTQTHSKYDHSTFVQWLMLCQHLHKKGAHNPPIYASSKIIRPT